MLRILAALLVLMTMTAGASAAPDPAVITGSYPTASLRARESGVVEVVFAVDAEGRAHDCTVVRSSGFPRLDHDACKTILASSAYKPASVDGKPVASRRRAKLRFAIDDAPAATPPPA